MGILILIMVKGHLAHSWRQDIIMGNGNLSYSAHLSSLEKGIDLLVFIMGKGHLDCHHGKRAPCPFSGEEGILVNIMGKGHGKGHLGHHPGKRASWSQSWETGIFVNDMGKGHFCQRH
jgi:hypothetical protein